MKNALCFYILCIPQLLAWGQARVRIHGNVLSLLQMNLELELHQRNPGLCSSSVFTQHHFVLLSWSPGTVPESECSVRLG